MILIDEYQDFNEVESAFVDILATKNKILIVGDDDQALYEFKGASPRFIREKYEASNAEYDSHTLRFCSRCTDAVIGAFHNIVTRYKLNATESRRIGKEYICYEPDKKNDSAANPKILLSKDTNVNSIPYFIKDQLTEILKGQRIKTVLVIGEAQSCSPQLFSVAKKLRHLGFKNVDHRKTERRMYTFRQFVVDAYKLLAKDNTSRLAWRILAELLPEEDRETLIQDDCAGTKELSSSLASDFKTLHERNAAVLSKLIGASPSTIKAIAKSSIDKLREQIVDEESNPREMLAYQLVEENQILPRPLRSLEITVCNILGSKGLGADVVFLIGFDQGKLPSQAAAKESEVYQFLVALTRAKKRIYLVNTINCAVSQFIDGIDAEFYQTI